MPSALANAYLQVIPSTKGLTKGIRDAMNDGSAEAAGGSYGTSLSSSIKSSVAAADIGDFIGKAIVATINEGADMEQSLGGVETMFRDSSQRVIDAANSAYKTAGLSANDYMQTVTGFSASLLQSLGGDTEAAASTADMAITDMADNANKFGSDMSSIQNAYQGFAMQNYIMLDNLKLGYGGAKKEMERLLADAQTLTGVEYNMESLDDVYNAIHAIQSEMGITGTTAIEASTTFTGSFAAMGSAAKNVLASLALGEDITPSLTALGETIYTWAFDNLIPMMGRIVKGVGEAALELITKFFTVENLQTLIESASELLTRLAEGISDAIPKLIAVIPPIIAAIVVAISTELPTIISAGIDIIFALIDGLINSRPQLVAVIPDIIIGIVHGLVDNLDKIILAAPKIIMAIVEGVVSAIPQLLEIFPSLILAIVDTFRSYDWASIGGNIIAGLKEGFLSMWNSFVDSVKKSLHGLVDTVKAIFGIESPSKLMRDEVGVMLARGIGVGFTRGMDKVNHDMANSLTDLFGSPVTSVVQASLSGGERIGAVSTGIAGGYRIDNLNVTFETIEELSAVLEWLKNSTRTSRMKGETA